MNKAQVDPFEAHLASYLTILDVAFLPLQREIVRSAPYLEEHLLDSAEYLVGAGFVAIQKYMLETCLIRKVDLANALRLVVSDRKTRIGTDEPSFATAVWAAANYWKHDADWWNACLSSCDEQPPKNSMQRNLDNLQGFGDFRRDYLCSNVLAAFTPINDLRLCALLPKVRGWRENLISQPL